MHILMLLSKSVKTDHRVSKEAATLSEAGHRVSLIEWARHEPTAPDEEAVGPISVRRVHHTGAARLAPGPLLGNPVWWRRAEREGLRLHAAAPIDAVHAHDLDTLVPAVRLKRRLRIPLVYDAHERFSEMITGNVPWPVPRLAENLERRLAPRADHILNPSDELAAHYARATGSPTTVIRNAFGPVPERYRPPTEKQFTVTYIGLLSRDRLFPGIVDALAPLPDVRFVVGGKREGTYAATEAAARRHDNITFLGTVPFADVLPTTLRGHAVLCPLDPKNPQYRTAFATKLYDAMATGRPLITTRGTKLGDFVEKHEMGIAAPYDPDALAAAVATLASDPERARRMGEQALELGRNEYNWPRQAERLLSVYRTLGA